MVTCIYCRAVLKKGYPGNDPENGPAGYYCENGSCQCKEFDEEYEKYLDSLEPKFPAKDADEMLKAFHYY